MGGEGESYSRRGRITGPFFVPVANRKAPPLPLEETVWAAFRVQTTFLHPEGFRPWSMLRPKIRYDLSHSSNEYRPYALDAPHRLKTERLFQEQYNQKIDPRQEDLKESEETG